jgi:hypothetical protein
LISSTFEFEIHYFRAIRIGIESSENMETLKIKRKIVSTHLEIDELINWLGKEVDIIIKEKSVSTDSPVGTVAGILSEFQDKKRIAEENYGWTKALKEKHGDR